MPQSPVFYVENLEHEVEPLGLINLKNIPFDEFVHQAFSQLWGDLQGIDPQTQQELYHPFNVLLVVILL